MKTTKSFFLSALTVFALIPLNVFAGGSSTVGPANPSSVLCLQKKGENVTILNSLGEAGLCAFGQAGIESWTFWRYTRGQRILAVDAFLNGKSVLPRSAEGVNLANPASRSCVRQGGESQIYGLENGSQIGLCVFPDDSAIEEWTLFYGVKNPRNSRLVRALR